MAVSRQTVVKDFQAVCDGDKKTVQMRGDFILVHVNAFNIAEYFSETLNPERYVDQNQNH